MKLIRILHLWAAISCGVLPTQAATLRRLPERHPVSDNDHHHNRQLQVYGGQVFIVLSRQAAGIDWCMDAAYGNSEIGTQYPSVALRPCAMVAAPSEQLFHQFKCIDESSCEDIESNFPGNVCLLVEDGEKVPEDGDRIRLGPCDLGESVFRVKSVNSREFWIQIASNTTLCVTYEGNSPGSGDRLLLETCESTDKFRWFYRSGWYRFGVDGCVQVEDQDASIGSKVVNDNCGPPGLYADWRMDEYGLLHTRANDDLCMRASSATDGAEISLANCNTTDSNQRWIWPEHWEDVIALRSAPNLYLVPDIGSGEDCWDAEDNEAGPMILSANPCGYSAETIHR